MAAARSNNISATTISEISETIQPELPEIEASYIPDETWVELLETSLYHTTPMSSPEAVLSPESSAASESVYQQLISDDKYSDKENLTIYSDSSEIMRYPKEISTLI